MYTPARAACLTLAALLSLIRPAAAQNGPELTPISESGRDVRRMVRYSATDLALPNTPIDADLTLASDRAHAWKADGGAHHVLLEGNVRVGIGVYAFGAEKAAIIITPSPRPGVDARQVAVYFDNVTDVGGTAPIRQSANRLLVTAVLVGKVELSTASMADGAADNDPLMVATRGRLTRYMQALDERVADVPAGPTLVNPSKFVRRFERRQQLDADLDPDVPPRVAESLDPQKLGKPPVPPLEPLPPIVRADPEHPDQPQLPDPARPDRPGLPDGPGARLPKVNPAQVDFHAGRVVYQRGESESYVLLLGDLQVMYVDPESGRRVTLTADKGVIFLAPETENAAGVQSFNADSVTGVYLEDNVIATDGDYTLRGPRVFYDLAGERAIVLEAVFYTWDVDRQVPIYVRANQLRQHSAKEWSAREARLTTSEFYEPHFSIGVETLTITREEQPGGVARHGVQAKNITLNAGQTPLFLWPGVSGDATDFPLRSVNAGYNSDRGGVIESTWDLFALANIDKPRGVDAELLVDGYTNRGAGIGTNFDYDVENAFGVLEAYYLHDDGEDSPNGRDDVDPSTNERGRVLWQHRHLLPDNWEATVQFAWISDPTFLEEWFSSEAAATKEYETSLYLKKQQDDWAFTFLTKYDLLDFIPQTDLLQGRGNIGLAPDIGYTTHKLPELEYIRVATPLWDDRLTWYSENRASVMRLNLPRDNPRGRGFSAAESAALFGIAPGTEFDSALRAAGLDQDTRYRLDTRQEIVLPLEAGPINIAPYAVGRITFYDQDFDRYAGEDDEVRFWGGGGVRMSTSFSRNYDAVESDLLDLHRMRHIIEPHVHLFAAETNIEQDDLPVYDYTVESLAEGFTAQFGVRNTLQTQRGGEGNWRSVDFVRIDTNFVMTSDETAEESPIARFFDYRPEYSLAGDHLFNEVAWQATDTLAVIGNVNYSFEYGDVAQWNAGFTLDHSPRLTSYVALRRIHAVDSMVLQYGVDYVLTPKWHLGFNQSFDLEEGNNRNVSVTLTRRLPRWLLIIALDVDTIGDVSSLGVALAPEGVGGPGSIGRNPFMQDTEFAAIRR